MDGRSTTIKQALSEPANLAAVMRKLGLRGTRSRTRLASSLCRQFRFLDARGKPQVFTCLKALRDLEDAGHFRLPPRQLDTVSHWRARRLAEPVPEPEGVPAEAGDVLGLRLVVVTPDDDAGMRTWNELMAREHPQGERRLVGRQLRYLLGSRHGWLGAIGFSASALRLEARDLWIGWTNEQRRRHQDRARAFRAVGPAMQNSQELRWSNVRVGSNCDVSRVRGPRPLLRGRLNRSTQHRR